MDFDVSKEYNFLMVKPAKRNGTKYKYSSFGGPECLSSMYAQISPDSWLNYNLDDTTNPIFIKELVMSQIDFELTFRTRGKTENEVTEKEGPRGKMRGIKLIGMTLANFDRAPFRLNSLVITNVYGSYGDI